MVNLIEPSSFDLIVLGTGLPQSIVAAAAASSGHSVLHLDPCEFYGDHWTSFSLQDFSDWASSHGSLPFSPPSPSQPPEPPVSDRPLDSNGLLHHPLSNGPAALHSDASSAIGTLENGIGGLAIAADQEASESISEAAALASMGLEAIDVEPDRSMYSDFHVFRNSAEDLGPSRSFNIDIAGPKLAFCGGPLVDLLLRSGAGNYLEFKGLEASYMWTSEGFSPVPSSRADVFKVRTMSPVEKRYLMRFFKLVVDHASSEESELNAEDLDAPFVELLRRQQLPSSIQAIILYAIALANDDQEQVLDRSSTISAREGLSSLALYLTSVGRFPNATGAFLYPLYGQGELPQAFCRCAAVKGALYVLRMRVDALLRDQDSHEFKGIKTSSGQLIFSQKLVTGPSLYRTLINSSDHDSRSDFGQIRNLTGGSPSTDASYNRMCSKIVRCSCITDKSLLADLSTVMVIFPPQSVTERVPGVIRALQVGGSASICPEGMFLVHLSIVCTDGLAGLEALQAATRSLFLCQGSTAVELAGLETNVGETVQAVNKPTLLFAVFYIQHCLYPQDLELWISPGHVAVCGMPDQTLDYRSLVASAEKVFQGLYPEEIFFQRNANSENDIEGAEPEPEATLEYSTDVIESS